MTRIVVAGGTGFIGSALTRTLTARGDEVVVFSRSPQSGSPSSVEFRRWSPSRGELDPDALRGVDVVVNLVGAGIGDRRWTRARKLELLLSRTGPTLLLAEAIALGRSDGSSQVRALIQGSAVGYYGDRPGARLTETSPQGSGFIPDLVQQWEAAAIPAAVGGARVVLARTGLVLDARGGALSRMLPLIRRGVGGPLGSGMQQWAWITLHDHVAALVHLIDSELSGPVNLVAPNPATNAEVTAAIATAFDRKSWLPVPRLALRLALGGFASEILASQEVTPAALAADGFTFAYPDVTAAAAWLRHEYQQSVTGR